MRVNGPAIFEELVKHPSGLFAEHFLQPAKYGDDGFGWQTAKTLEQAFRVDCAQLVKRHKAGPSLKLAVDTPRIRLPAGGHWGHDDGAKRPVEFVW
jgi:hypothetical protein